jgi:hypothetical protein
VAEDANVVVAMEVTPVEVVKSCPTQLGRL